MLVGNFVGSAIGIAFGFVFVGIFDTIAYFLLQGAYSLFMAVASIDIFSTEGGNKIFTEISSRLYNVVFIIAVFVISYQVLMYIINPDKNRDKLGNGTGNMVKQILFSVVFVIMCPLIFKYMAIFQKHVLQEGTIASIITGQGTSPKTKFVGKGLALSTFISVYHPTGTDFNTFFEYKNGNLNFKTDCVEQCTAIAGNEKTCKVYIAGLIQAHQNLNNANSVVGDVGSDYLNGKIWDDYSMEYYWVISTGVALYIAWFFFSYTFDIGARAVKLGVLQLIAPIPILMKPFEKPGGTYDKWFKELVKCYAEIFIRIAVVFVTVKLIELFPAVITAIIDANNNNTDSGFFAKAFAFIVFILGILKFAKDAPDLFKNIFSGGGNWLSGLDLKPGVKRRVENNTYAMKGLSAGAGLASGAIGGAFKGFHDNKYAPFAARIGHSAVGMLRGAGAGVSSGFKNSTDKLKGLGQVADTARSAAHYKQDHNWSTRHRSLVDQAYSDAGIYLDPNATVGDKFEALKTAQGKFFMGKYDDAKESLKDTKMTLTGEKGYIDEARVNNLNLAGDAPEAFRSIVTAINKEFDDKIAKEKETMAGATDQNYYSKQTKKEYKYDKGEWVATDGSGSTYLADVKTARQQAMVDYYNRAENQNTKGQHEQQLKETLGLMESYFKNANLSGPEYKKLAEEFTKSSGLSLDSDDLAKGFSKAIMGVLRTQCGGNPGKIFMGLQSMGTVAKNMNSIEAATLNAQKQTQQAKDDSSKKS